MEISCTGEPGEVFDLRAFRRSQHRAIVFDELDARTVLKNKKFFQSTNAVISLGQSPTLQHVYSVCVHQIALIVTSNIWMGTVVGLAEADRNWLTANSVVVDVREPLWLGD